MIELDDSRDLLEAFLELRDLLEVVTELNNGRGLEHTLRVDDELTVLEHPRFPAYQVRMKKSEFCDPTVKCA